MKRSLLAATTAATVLALACTASAQQASEAQDQATLQNAASTSLTAQGEYNYNAAAAAVQEEAARAAALDTSSRGLREWYARKQLHSDYIAAKTPISSPGLLGRLAELKRPDRLTIGQYSRQERKLNWPAILNDPVFDRERIALDEIFAQREAFDAGTDSQFYREAKHHCKKMYDTMLASIDQMTTTDSISARKFLRSLEFEARILPSDLGGLAVSEQQ